MEPSSPQLDGMKDRHPELPRYPHAQTMSRTDSGLGEAYEHLTVEVDASHNTKRSSLPEVIRDKDTRNIRSASPNRRASPKHAPNSTTMMPRKHSVSSTVRSKPRSSASRSSSIHSRRTRGDEHRPRRIQSSPVGLLPRSNVEEALAFHERSCQIMQSLSRTASIAQSPGTYSDYIHNTALYSSPPFVYSHTRQSSISFVHNPDTPPVEEVTVPHHQPDPVIHWTSNTTRRKEYAEIDKRNRGLRKFMRKLMPDCISKPAKLDFYNEKEDSDAGSVRRYRLDLADDEKNE